MKIQKNAVAKNGAVDPKYVKQAATKLMNKNLQNSLRQHDGDDDGLVTAVVEELPQLRNIGKMAQFGERPSKEQMRVQKCESPAQLVDGLHDLIKEMPVEPQILGIDKWRIIYQGILNPQSQHGKFFKKTMESRKKQFDDEKRKNHREVYRKRRIKKVAQQLAVG